MLRSLILRILYRMMLPRGAKFVTKPHLEKDWKHQHLHIKGVKLWFISKKSSAENRINVAVVLAHPYLTEGRYFF